MKTKNNKITKTTPSQSATAVKSLNDFSDEILTHILSFLPFKDAFRTTILSKRWLPLFHSLPILHFDDTGVKTTDDWIIFRQSMNSVMFSPHSHNLTLKSFHLKCFSRKWDSKSDRFTLNDWLQEAKRRRVEELNLFILFGDIETMYELMEAVEGGYSKPSLSKLIKAGILYSMFRSVEFPLGQSFPNEEINTYYKGFPVFINLIELRLSWFQRCILDWNEVVTMLQNCPKLQTLSISKCRSSTTTEDWNYPDHVPECFSSHLTTWKIIDYEPVEADFQFATYILQNARVLQVMEIHCPFTPKAMTSPKFIEDLISCPRISPACKLSLE